MRYSSVNPTLQQGLYGGRRHGGSVQPLAAGSDAAQSQQVRPLPAGAAGEATQGVASAAIGSPRRSDGNPEAAAAGRVLRQHLRRPEAVDHDAHAVEASITAPSRTNGHCPEVRLFCYSNKSEGGYC